MMSSITTASSASSLFTFDPVNPFAIIPPETEMDMNSYLYDNILNYYRFQHPNTSLRHLLHHPCFSFRHHSEHLFDRLKPRVNNYEVGCIIADCQSGKTYVTIPAIFLTLAMEYCPILICHNSVLKEQFVSRIRSEAKILFEKLNIPITPKLSKMFFEPLFLESGSRAEKDFCDELQEALYTNRLCPRIIILLKQQRHLKAVNTVINSNLEKAPPSIFLFFDEYQVTGVIKELDKEDDDGDDERNESLIKVKYDNEVDNLRMHVTREIGITATAEDVYLLKRIKMKNFCFLEPSRFYRGRQWFFTLTEDMDPNDCRSILRKMSTFGAQYQLENIETIQTIISDFNNGASIPLKTIVKQILLHQKPYVRTNFRDLDRLPQKDEHPVVSLVMLERLKSEQDQQAINFLEENKDISGFALIIFNGDKISIICEHVSEMTTVRRENGDVIGLNKSNGVFGKFSPYSEFTDNRVLTFYKGTISIQDAMEWVGNFNNPDRSFRSPIKRICIVAYDMTNCGISMISHYCSVLNYHLTMLVLLVRNLDAALTIQRANRLSGNHGDDIGLILITTRKIYDLLLYAQHRNKAVENYIKTCQQDIVEREKFINEEIIRQRVMEDQLHNNYHKKSINNKNPNGMYENKIPNPLAEETRKSLVSHPFDARSAEYFGNNNDLFVSQVKEITKKKKNLADVPVNRNFTETTPLEEEVKRTAVDNSNNSNPKKRKRTESETIPDNMSLNINLKPNETIETDIILDNGMNKEEFNRLTKKMFPVWAKGNSKISLFMQNLDPVKNFTANELKEYALSVGIQEIIHLTKSIVGNKTNGYGMIMRKNNNGTYQMYPCLLEYFNKNFDF